MVPSPAALLLSALALPAHADLVRPDLELPDDPDALAELVARRAGDPYAESLLAFTFVVVADGVEKARRSHRWCPQAGKVEVRVGDRVTVISAVDGRALDATTDEAAASEAWSAFVNDGYWLLAPSKVLDPGVRRSRQGQALLLSFDGVGLTPGDRYTLGIDPQTRLVTRWDYVLQSGREGHFAWQDHRRVGGLMLSTLRVSDDGSFQIRFEDVSVGETCPL